MQAILPMTSQTAGLRKAAILVACLDQNLADLLLDQMTPEQAQRVRNTVMDLGLIDESEQKRIIEEFFRVGPKPVEKYPPGIELDRGLTEKFAPAAKTMSAAAESAAGDEPAFRFLREAEGDRLARVLASERPQTIALVLAHLPPERAGNVLVRLSPAMQVEVVHRLVDLEETDPEILREVERGLMTRLSEQVGMQRRRVAGLSAVKGIVDSSESHVGMKILHTLAAHDRPLANRLGRQPLEFDDLLRLDQSSMRTLIGAVDQELLTLALVGALPELVERVLWQLPDGQAKRMRRGLDHLGPTRLSDVEEARRQVVELVQDMALDGRLQLPRRPEVLQRAA